jgi:hypothetical protein
VKKKEKKSVDFQLSKNLKYARKGDFEETATIIMHAPSMDTLEESQNLSQLVMRAMADSQKFADSSGLSPELAEKARVKAEEEGLKGPEVRMMLLASESVKFMQVINEFKRLAIKVCYVANDIKMTNSMFDKMDLDDFTGMVCNYIANFITPSLLLEE